MASNPDFKVGDKVTLNLKGEQGGGIKLSTPIAGIITAVGAEAGPRVRCEDHKTRNALPINLSVRLTTSPIDQAPAKATRKTAAPSP